MSAAAPTYPSLHFSSAGLYSTLLYSALLYRLASRPASAGCLSHCYCDGSLLLRFADNCVIEQVELVLLHALVE
jgi:hypothetical protein